MSAVMKQLQPGQVLIRDKVYDTVALRVQKFWNDPKHEGWSLLTEAVKIDVEVVVVKAFTQDQTGRVRSTGHAEEYRGSTPINKTSALENAETSAIGRCLAALGLGGTEFATADEVAHAITSKAPAPAKGVIKPSDGAMEGLTAARRNVVMDTAVQVQDYLSEGKDFDAYGLCESIEDQDEKVAMWSLLDSKQRARIKAASAAHRKPASE